MYVTKKTTTRNQVSKVVKPGTLQMPQPLEVALNHFFKMYDNPNEVRNDLMKIFHMALESDTIESLDKFDRSNLFFTVRNLCTLSDALFIQKKLLTKK